MIIVSSYTSRASAESLPCSAFQLICEYRKEDIYYTVDVLFFFEARVGFEPALRVLQTHALPLGYLAINIFLKNK